MSKRTTNYFLLFVTANKLQLEKRKLAQKKVLQFEEASNNFVLPLKYLWTLNLSSSTYTLRPQSRHLDPTKDGGDEKT